MPVAYIDTKKTGTQGPDEDSKSLGTPHGGFSKYLVRDSPDDAMHPCGAPISNLSPPTSNMSSLSALQAEGTSSTPRKRPPTPMKTSLPSSLFRRRQLSSISSMDSHQLTVTHKLAEVRDSRDNMPPAQRRKELDALAEESSGFDHSEGIL